MCVRAHACTHTHTRVYTHTYTCTHTHTPAPPSIYPPTSCACPKREVGGGGGRERGEHKRKNVQRDKSCKGKPVVILGFVHVYIDTTLAYEVHIVCDLPLVHAPCVTHDNARATMQQIKRMCQSVTIMQRSNGVWEEVGGT